MSRGCTHRGRRSPRRPGAAPAPVLLIGGQVKTGTGVPLPEPEGTGAVEPGAGIEGVDLLVVDDRDDVEEIEEVVDPPVQVEHGGGGVGGVDLADQCGGAGELPGVGGVRVVCQAGLHVIRGERGAVMEEDAGPQVEGDGESVAADVPGFGERGLRGEGCGTVLGLVAGQRIEDESGG